MKFSFTKALKIVEKTNGCCLYCKKELKFGQMSVDHIVPKVLGGDNSINNLALACKNCNHEKNNLTIEVYCDIFNVEICENIKEYL